MDRMFFNAVPFSQNLCNWAFTLSPNASVVEMFAGTSCPDPSDPNLTATPVNPLCYSDCTGVYIPVDFNTTAPPPSNETMAPANVTDDNATMTPSMAPSLNDTALETTPPTLNESLAPSKAPAAAPAAAPVKAPIGVPTVSTVPPNLARPPTAARSSGRQQDGVDAVMVSLVLGAWGLVFLFG
jgi:hypothetical protein